MNWAGQGSAGGGGGGCYQLPTGKIVRYSCVRVKKRVRPKYDKFDDFTLNL